MDKRNDRLRRRISEILVGGFLVLSVIICITVMTQVFTIGYVRIAGLSVFRVVTGSMEPEIPVDALLICKKISAEDIQKNDIICFRSKEQGRLGSIITHRVINIFLDKNNQIQFETKGDANVVSDGYYVTEENLVGKVIWFTGEKNMLASVLAFLNNKIGFLACIVFPCLLIAVVVLRECISNIRREMSEVLRNEQSETQMQLELTPEEYQEIYERVRAELMEELGLSAEKKSK